MNNLTRLLCVGTCIGLSLGEYNLNIGKISFEYNLPVIEKEEKILTYSKKIDAILVKKEEEENKNKKKIK